LGEKKSKEPPIPFNPKDATIPSQLRKIKQKVKVVFYENFLVILIVGDRCESDIFS